LQALNLREGRRAVHPISWKDILELRRAQLAAAGAAQASQMALFATLHDDRRPRAERTASGRYREPSLLDCM
jgi:hypothetical protein